MIAGWMDPLDAADQARDAADQARAEYGEKLTSRVDTVDHPTHYSRWKMEPIEFIAINDLPWWLANLIKYTMRYDAKDGLQDLYKGRSYLDMKIRHLENHKRFWEKPVSEERRLNEQRLDRR